MSGGRLSPLFPLLYLRRRLLRLQSRPSLGITSTKRTRRIPREMSALCLRMDHPHLSKHAHRTQIRYTLLVLISSCSQHSLRRLYELPCIIAAFRQLRQQQQRRTLPPLHVDRRGMALRRNLERDAQVQMIVGNDVVTEMTLPLQLLIITVLYMALQHQYFPDRAPARTHQVIPILHQADSRLYRLSVIQCLLYQYLLHRRLHRLIKVFSCPASLTSLLLYSVLF